MGKVVSFKSAQEAQTEKAEALLIARRNIQKVRDIVEPYLHIHDSVERALEHLDAALECLQDDDYHPREGEGEAG